MASKVRSIQREREKRAQTQEASPQPQSIKVKLGDIIDANAHPVYALSELMGKPLPTRITYQLSKLAQRINQEAEAYDRARKTLCEKYGTENKEARRYDIRKDKQDDFDRELKELRDTEVDLSIYPIKLDVLEAAQQAYNERPLSAAVMLLLHWLIVE